MQNGSALEIESVVVILFEAEIERFESFDHLLVEAVGVQMDDKGNRFGDLGKEHALETVEIPFEMEFYRFKGGEVAPVEAVESGKGYLVDVTSLVEQLDIFFLKSLEYLEVLFVVGVGIVTFEALDVDHLDGELFEKGEEVFAVFEKGEKLSVDIE